MRHLIALGLFLSVGGCDTGERVSRLEKQTEELKAELKKNDAAIEYDLQAKCAKDSQIWFSEHWSSRDKDTLLLMYVNHYNVKMNKCFIRVEFHYRQDQNGSWSNDMSLWDIYENMRYGTVSENHMHFLKPLAEVKTEVSTCEVLGTECKTMDEFNNLARPYLNN